MSPDDGSRPRGTADKSVGDLVAEVSEKASLLIREEIELAKAEITQKVTRLAMGAAVGAAAGVFAALAGLYFLHALAWFIDDAFNWEASVWPGFLIVTFLLLVIGAVAGYIAFRAVKAGTPPTPKLAIEEARLTREAIDQARHGPPALDRSLEAGEQIRTRGAP